MDHCTKNYEFWTFWGPTIFFSEHFFPTFEVLYTWTYRSLQNRFSSINIELLSDIRRVQKWKWSKLKMWSMRHGLAVGDLQRPDEDFYNKSILYILTGIHIYIGFLLCRKTRIFSLVITANGTREQNFTKNLVFYHCWSKELNKLWRNENKKLNIVT